MTTIGQILKSARISKNISLAEIEKETKIKSSFIKLIESNSWDELPAFPVVSGFVKNLAIYLDISPESANAFLRRDYPPKKIAVTPKPDIENKLTWSPKLTFAVGIVSLVVMVLGYLGYEYFKFIKPPELEVVSPYSNQIVINSSVVVSGKTTTDVMLSVNNQPIIVDQNGNFVTEIKVDKDTKTLKFKAVSRSGKTTEKIVEINVE